mgnify:CR=1 FL=1
MGRRARFSRSLYAQNGEIRPVRVPLTAEKMKKILVWDDMDGAEAILKRLGIEKAAGGREIAEYGVPTRRCDIAIEVRRRLPECKVIWPARTAAWKSCPRWTRRWSWL